MKLFNPILTGSLTVALGTASLSASWVVVDKFEDTSLPGWHVHIPNIDNPDRVDPNNPPRITVVSDPFGGGGNALEVFPGVLIDQTVNMFASLLIPEEARIVDPFPAVGIATMYLRLGRPQVGDRPALVDSAHGLVGFFIDEMGNLVLDEDGNPQRPNVWGHFSALARFEPDGTFDVWDSTDGRNYTKMTDSLATDTWYEVWYVINHPENTFRVYMRGGPEFPNPDPTLVFPFGEITNDAVYRVATFEDLAFFMIGTSTGSVSGGARGVDPYYISEIHIDPTAMNLTTPPGVGEGEPTPTNPFAALVEGEWVEIPNVGLNYGFQAGPGWSFHVDLGFIYSESFPWLYHQPRGWLFYQGGNYNAEGIYLYSPDLGWLFTAAAADGMLYVFNTGEWVTP